MPLISIVMPVYQVEQYIAASVASVCRQSFRDFELILVDDGSLDHSIQNAVEILEKNTIQYRVVAKRNGGQSSARNAGIMAAEGEWVICVDSDDCLHPSTFEIISKYTGDSETDVIAFDFYRTHGQTADDMKFEVDLSCQPVFYNSEQLAGDFLLRKLKLIVPSLLIRRAYYSDRRNQYDENCRYSEDQLFIWNLIMNTGKLAFIPIKLYFYLDRPNSIMTASSKEKIMTGFYAFEHLADSLSASRRTLEHLYPYILPRWIMGTFHSAVKQMEISYGEFITLSDDCGYRRHIPVLFGFPDMRIAVLSRLLMLNRRLFYFIISKV
jgi:glycosyltransferase involved in cell wall biosynthesis